MAKKKTKLQGWPVDDLRIVEKPQGRLYVVYSKKLDAVTVASAREVMVLRKAGVKTVPKLP
ncbi:MAG TPA: hypothetical protein VGP72_10875 [Planctomycetota bacterium]